MSNEKMRDEFEEWAEKYGYNVKTDGADYYCHETSEAYAAWQASRAALCVELPERAKEWYGSPAVDGHNDALDLCRSAIESTGVRTR